MAKTQNQSHQVYLQLRDRIATGELKPGDVMSETNLAKEFGLSRTPIGEALRQLSQEGMVEQVPRFGTIVREISPRELRELFDIREALEGMAAEKAADRMPASTLEELHSLCRAIDDELERHRRDDIKVLDKDGLRRFLSADMAFHTLIIASAGNERLSQMIEQTRTVSAMFAARRGVHAMERVDSANQAHKSIAFALEQGDGRRARQIVEAHIQTSRDQSLASLDGPAAPATLHTIDLPEYVRRGLHGPQPHLRNNS